MIYKELYHLSYSSFVVSEGVCVCVCFVYIFLWCVSVCLLCSEHSRSHESERQRHLVYFTLCRCILLISYHYVY